MELTKALVMGRDLMREHGLTDWVLVLDRAKTRAGACRFGRQEISISQWLTLLHDEDEVRETILHEIAHALAGPSHGHDATWRAVAKSIGSRGERCASAEVARVAGAWQGVCSHGHTVDRHKRPVRVGICARCHGPDAARVFEWTFHGQPVPMHPNYVAELAALRAGRPTLLPGRLRPGQAVRIAAPGEYHGQLGRIVKRGRSRYTVRTPEVVLTVPFAWVEAT